MPDEIFWASRRELLNGSAWPNAMFALTLRRLCLDATRLVSWFSDEFSKTHRDFCCDTSRLLDRVHIATSAHRDFLRAEVAVGFWSITLKTEACTAWILASEIVVSVPPEVKNNKQVHSSVLGEGCDQTRREFLKFLFNTESDQKSRLRACTSRLLERSAGATSKKSRWSGVQG